MQKRFFASHAKSSAALISIAIHAILLVVAVSFVAVTVIKREEQEFFAKPLSRKKATLKKLKVPVNVKKKRLPKPKLRNRIIVKANLRNAVPDIKIPEVMGVKGGVTSLGDNSGGDGGIGFSMPEIDFFGTKSKGEKVVFIVHFGPNTIGKNPYTRMTGLTIRKRLDDMIHNLPAFCLFNVACYYVGDTIAFSDRMLLASEVNKQNVSDWMEPVNPLVGEYSHCFSWDEETKDKIKIALNNYPEMIDQGLPFYSPKWIIPYEVPDEINQNYLGDDLEFTHWNRAVTWALQTQKPDTIFILSTNYIDPWGDADDHKDKGDKERGEKKKKRSESSNNPVKLAKVYKKMIVDQYGMDRKKWPKMNVVVLQRGENSKRADKTLSDQFGPIYKAFQGEGSIIYDITKYMTDEEAQVHANYKAEYENAEESDK